MVDLPKDLPGPTRGVELAAALLPRSMKVSDQGTKVMSRRGRHPPACVAKPYVYKLFLGVDALLLNLTYPGQVCDWYAKVLVLGRWDATILPETCTGLGN